MRAGRRLVALGGSDLHRLKTPDPDSRHARDLGSPTTWVYAGDDRTPAGVLGALRAGRVFVSRDPTGPQLFFDRDSENVRVRVVGARGAGLMLVSASGVEHSIPIGAADWTHRFRTTDWPGYLRAQVLDEHGQVLALSNPLYARPG
ncbi:MAG: hypothetical protein LC797_08450 [Chloroflexi bacterium]|nr:hypothetical protein [Chloroflexota bacterium]